MDLKRYRVTMPKGWKGSARIVFKGATFDLSDEDKESTGCRIKEMRLNPLEVNSLVGRGFLVTEIADKPADFGPKTKRGKARKKKAKEASEEGDS